MVDAGRTKEINWLRDILPRLLEQNQQAIYPRVMAYGYDADVWMTRTVADLDVPVTNLLTYLDTERIEVSKPSNHLIKLFSPYTIKGSGTPSFLHRAQLGRNCN